MNKSEQLPPLSDENQPILRKANLRSDIRRRRETALKAILLLVIFVVGIGSGYLIGKKSVHTHKVASSASNQADEMPMMEMINPLQGYTIAAAFKDVGPRLVAAGGINLVKFIALYQQQNSPLTDSQLNILQKGTTHKVIFTVQDAYFLLNFFWALGLTNQNDILTNGPLLSGGIEKVGGFASTGGWTLGAKQPTDLYASTQLITLTDEQQARLLEVASAVYRPCCNNPTHFPDCNHGMAMLGLLELMASQNATIDQMFEAAKYANAFWYPQQMLEIAMAFKSVNQLDFNQVDSKEVVSYKYSSGSGYQAVHQWLSQNGLLEQAPSAGGSCGVK
jgi:hypothetical protein